MVSPGRLRLLLAVLLASSAARADAGPGVVTPPRVVRHVDAVYPERALHEGHDAIVVLFVTVLADGTVGDVSVVEPGGHGLDEAAIAAVRQWRLEPARRDGTPIASRIRVPFHFAPPGDHAPAEPARAAAAPASPPASAPGPDAAPEVPGIAGGVTDVHRHDHPPTPAPIEVTVVGKLPQPTRTAGDVTVDAKLLASAPRATAVELLSSAPGVYVSQPEGPIGPPELFLRGFDAEHGRDLEVVSSGIPLNQPGHVHAHGYAEQRGILPETVLRVRLRPGPFDPRQGEYAVAGSVSYELGVAERGTRVSGSLGQYGTARLSAVWAPEGEADETFGAFAYARSSGDGAGRSYRLGSGVAQQVVALGARARATWHVAAHAARSGLLGVVRQDDLDAGLVAFGDRYADPSVAAQGITTARTEASVAIEAEGLDGARWGVTPFFAITSFRLRENFTGYTLGGARAMAEGKADLYDERNEDTTVGATSFYRSARRTLAGIDARAEVGASLRRDGVTQADGLLYAAGDATWQSLIDASIAQSTLGGYVDADLGWGPVRLRGGGRADVVSQVVDDRLATGRAGAAPGVRRDATSAVFSPRATLEVAAAPWLALTAAYGRGFRSAPARVLVTQGVAPIAIADAYEVGATAATASRSASVSLTGFRTTMSSDLEFDPTTATVESVGPTTRQGASLYVRARREGLIEHATGVTYTHATLDAPPPSGDPGAAVAGDRVPFVPPLLARSDTTLTRRIADVSGSPVTLSLGAAATWIAPRPAQGGGSIDAAFLLDGVLSSRWRWLEAGVSAANLLGSSYVDHAFSFTSQWSAARATPDLARHVVAGPPRMVLATVVVHL